MRHSQEEIDVAEALSILHKNRIIVSDNITKILGEYTWTCEKNYFKISTYIDSHEFVSIIGFILNLDILSIKEKMEFLANYESILHMPSFYAERLDCYVSEFMCMVVENPTEQNINLFAALSNKLPKRDLVANRLYLTFAAANGHNFERYIKIINDIIQNTI